MRAISIIMRDIRNCEYFRAMDGSTLCELLHPARQPSGVPVPEMEIPFSIAHAIIKPGETTKLHRLHRSVEIYYVLEGEGIISIDGESAPVHSGQVIYIHPGSTQQLRNTGNSILSILCIVHPMWRSEDEEVIEE